jgi:ParB-like chromosome segregation protein Spo0J
MQIQPRPIEGLIPYARNSRTHSDEQVAQIAASIREFGWTNPVLVDGENGIIAGHGRVLAARKLGMDEVPCIELAGLTDTQRRAYIIADNKLALNAGWADDMLRIELEALGELGFDLDLIGFSDEEILALGVEDEDDEPDEETVGDAPKGSLSDRFMIPPFTVLNAREGWWQNRKRAWLALGIKSELGRGGCNMECEPGQHANAAPGGSARPACDYSNRQRGNGAGRPISG